MKLNVASRSTYAIVVDFVYLKAREGIYRAIITYSKLKLMRFNISERIFVMKFLHFYGLKPFCAPLPFYLLKNIPSRDEVESQLDVKVTVLADAFLLPSANSGGHRHFTLTKADMLPDKLLTFLRVCRVNATFTSYFSVNTTIILAGVTF